jgi:hypothetical protein
MRIPTIGCVSKRLQTLNVLAPDTMVVSWNKRFNTGPFQDIFQDDIESPIQEGWFREVRNLINSGFKPTYDSWTDQAVTIVAEGLTNETGKELNLVWIKLALTAGVPKQDLKELFEATSHTSDLAEFRGYLGDRLGVGDTQLWPLTMCVMRESLSLMQR